MLLLCYLQLSVVIAGTGFALVGLRTDGHRRLQQTQHPPHDRQLDSVSNGHASGL